MTRRLFATLASQPASATRGRRHSRRSRGLLLTRLAIILTASGQAPPLGLTEARRRVERLLEDSDPELLWMARSVLGSDLPGHEEMATLLRQCRLFGPWAALEPTIGTLDEQDPSRTVRVADSSTTCDVHLTASSTYTSGIQRVVRAAAGRWHAEHDVEFLGWNEHQTSMITLSEEQHVRLLGASGHPREAAVVIPWRGVHLIPEVFIDARRCDRIFTLAKYSGCRVGTIGYDCIPMTMSSSASPGMAPAFGLYLAACRQATRVAAISRAAAQEYTGWRTMLAGVREPGPDIATIDLPITASAPSPEGLERARQRLGLTSMPTVLVVGSHEPRKNHLAVLHAAESLWRQGLRFTLVIAGAGSWQAEAYFAEVRALRAAGRPVLSISGLSDELLWAAYHLAHCTLFPSLNEGFGLPVAESLAAGTPVITSNFGSTRDIVAPSGEPWGGLLVDPHDDDDIAQALRRMLTDPETHRRLREETSRHSPGSWEGYAARVWDFLVEGRAPQSS